MHPALTLRLSARPRPPCCNHPKIFLNLLKSAGGPLINTAGGISTNGATDDHYSDTVAIYEFEEEI